MPCTSVVRHSFLCIQFFAIFATKKVAYPGDRGIYSLKLYALMIT